MGALHIHIDTNEPLFLRQLHTCFDGIVKKIADDAAQINLRGFQLDGNMGIRNHRNTLGLCQRDFCVQNRIRHGITCLDNRIHGSQIFVQQVKIVLDSFPIFCGGVGFHRLNVIAVIVPPTTNLSIHIINFTIMRFNQLVLIGFNLFFYAL